MTSIFIPSNQEVAKKLYETVENGVAPNIDQGFIGGFWDTITAPINGAYNGIVGKPSMILADAGVELGKSIDYWTGLNTTDFFEASRDENKRQVESLIPNPKTSATATQLLYAFFEMAGQAYVGSRFGGETGAAVNVGTQQGLNDYNESIAQGIDPSTAADKAVITGIATGLGVAIPMTYGLRISPEAQILANQMKGVSKWAMKSSAAVTDVGLTTGANVAAGIGMRGFSRDLLEHNGYHEIAKQYDPLDREAVTVDTVMGLAFGAVGRYSNRRAQIPQETIDAALSKNSAIHAETGSAPGMPINSLSRDVHIKALRKAIDAVINGEKVDVTPLVSNAEFAPKSNTDFLREVTQAVKEAFPDLPMYYTRDDVGIPRDYIDTIEKRLKGEATNLLPQGERIQLKGDLQDLNYRLDKAKEEFKQALTPSIEVPFKGRGKRAAILRQHIQTERNRLQSVINALEQQINEKQAILAEHSEGGKYFEAKANLSRIQQGILPESLISLDDVGTLLQRDLVDTPTSEGQVNPAPQTVDELARTETTPSEVEIHQTEADISSVDQILRKDPEMLITTLDDQGNTITAKASDLLAEADAEIQQTQKDSPLFEIAAACLFRTK